MIYLHADIFLYLFFWLIKLSHIFCNITKLNSHRRPTWNLKLEKGDATREKAHRPHFYNLQW